MNETLEQWRQVKTEDEFLIKELFFKDSKLEDSFKSKMEFGTAGIRGIMGAGTDKMNVHTVAAATEAFAVFLKKGNKKNEIVIAHDNRHNSALFSIVAANVLQANGIKAILFPGNELQPTPLLSYAVRHTGATAGIMITASHNPKEYNGFKVYNAQGAQYLSGPTNKISKVMDKIDPIQVKQKEWKPQYIKQSLIDKYLKEVLALVNKDDASNISVSFSPQCGTSAVLGKKLIEETGATCNIVEKQFAPDPDFKHTKTPNPEDAKAYKKAFILAKKTKSDIILTTDPDADRVGFATRYKKRYKFLNGNEIAAVYLEYLLSDLKSKNKLPKNGFIVSTYVSGDLAKNIARSYGVEVIETYVGFKNIAAIMESNKKKKFLFAFEESYGCVIANDIARDKDSFQAMSAFIGMASHFKEQGTNAYDQLLALHKKYGKQRTMQFSKKLDKKMTNVLIKKLVDSKKKLIGGKKVAKVLDFRKDGINFVKAVFKDGSFVAIRPSGTEPKVKIYVQTIGTKKDRLMDIVYWEKSVDEWVKENSEEFEDKKFNWKAVFKYTLFIGIVVGMFLIVFFTIYSGSQTVTGSSSGLSTYTLASQLFNSQNRLIWLSLWLWKFTNDLINAWAMKRSLMIQGQKSRIRHLFIANIMSGIVSFLTPFAIGGDAVGYWYMRRKGIKRGPLIASYMTDTLLYQAKFSLQTVILFSLGYNLYFDIFSSNNPEATAALIWFFVGLSWMVFSTIMIFIILLSRRFQEFVVRKSVMLLEWTKFVTIADPGGVSASFMYEFREVRKGMKKIWKHPWYPIEMMLYRLAPMFFNPTCLVVVNTGAIKNGISTGPYWAQIVIGDIIGTANSMSITPGGSGTLEWLSIATGTQLYKGSNFINNFPASMVPNSREIASAFDLLGKIFMTWPALVFSGLITVLTIFYESKKSIRLSKIKRSRLLGSRVTPKSNAKYFVLGSVIVFWILLITLHMTVFFK